MDWIRLRSRNRKVNITIQLLHCCNLVARLSLRFGIGIHDTGFASVYQMPPRRPPPPPPPLGTIDTGLLSVWPNTRFHTSLCARSVEGYGLCRCFLRRDVLVGCTRAQPCAILPGDHHVTRELFISFVLGKSLKALLKPTYFL